MGPFRYVDSVADLVSDPYGPAKLFAPEDGSLWIIPVIRYKEVSAARWEADTHQIVLTLNEEDHFTVDAAGRAWVVRGDAEEIEMWEAGTWKAFGRDRGWLANTPLANIWWAPEAWRVLGDGLGRLWLPTQSDVRVFDEGLWTVFTTAEMGFSKPEWEDLVVYHSIARLENGNQTWVGECHYSPLGPMGGGGVRWYEGKEWKGGRSPVEDDCVSVLHVDPKGNLWIAVDDAAWRYQPAENSWTPFPLPEAALSGFNFNHPLDLLVDQSGDAWVIVQLCGGANCDGPSNLYRMHAGEWTLILEASDWWEPHKKLFSGADGRSWLLWEGVLYLIENGALVPVVAIDPRGLALDPFGRVWALVGKEGEAALWMMETAKWTTSDRTISINDEGRIR